MSSPLLTSSTTTTTAATTPPSSAAADSSVAATQLSSESLYQAFATQINEILNPAHTEDNKDGESKDEDISRTPPDRTNRLKGVLTGTIFEKRLVEIYDLVKSPSNQSFPQFIEKDYRNNFHFLENVSNLAYAAFQLDWKENEISSANKAYHSILCSNQSLSHILAILFHAYKAAILYLLKSKTSENSSVTEEIVRYFTLSILHRIAQPAILGKAFCSQLRISTVLQFLSIFISPSASASSPSQEKLSALQADLTKLKKQTSISSSAARTNSVSTSSSAGELGLTYVCDCCGLNPIEVARWRCVDLSVLTLICALCAIPL
jgi:hypothetical protein